MVYIADFCLVCDQEHEFGDCHGIEDKRLSGLKQHNVEIKIPLINVLIENSKYQSNKLRIRLIKEGYKKHECEVCHLNDWMGKKISLELDHINGVNTDNRIGNLRLICPNCHAQTRTYRGKNCGRASRKHYYASPPLPQSAEGTDLKSVKSEFKSQVEDQPK